MRNRKSVLKIKRSEGFFTTGYYLSIYGLAIILLWVGIFKFTPTEAKAIKPLVENHPLMSWLYDLLSVQGVSNLIGTTEIIIAISIFLAPYRHFLKCLAAVGITFIFATTLSFLFTTPHIWRIVDGVPITDFFILKDLVFLGIGLMFLNLMNRTQ